MVICGFFIVLGLIQIAKWWLIKKQLSKTAMIDWASEF